MLRTLYAKLSISLILLLLSIGLVYTLLSVTSTRQYLQEIDQQLNRDLASNLVMDRNLVEAGRLNEQALKQTFMEYMTINPSIEIYLLAIDGTILSYSADPGKVKRNKVSLEPIRDYLQQAGGTPVLGDDPRSHDRRKVFSVTPVPSAENPEGYLYVVLRGEQYDNVEQIIKESYLLRLSGSAVLGSLLFGLLAGLLLFHLLTRRLNRLSQHMDEFRLSDFSHFTPSMRTGPSGDELDKLSFTFDQMALRITEQLDQLKQQDALRRELVANVSHDLRTPLAILHGYLETMKLKANDLDDARRAKYLDAALHNSEHLETLVAALFELAKLEAHETVPVCEPFSAAELAQDVLQKFQLKANEKNISLQLEADEGLPFVHADIALIERVLENLLSNALHHSSPGGEIRIILKPQPGSLAISISDTGCGIAEQDLPYIFDRFYQARNQQRDKLHAGLGLAISKRILQLHDSDILVSSQRVQGTTFSFHLPLAAVSHGL